MCLPGQQPALTASAAGAAAAGPESAADAAAGPESAADAAAGPESAADAAAGPESAADAVAMAQAGLAFLVSADIAAMPPAALADCLRELERAEAMHTAARSKVLAAFARQRAFEDDGQGSAGSWLRWQARITRGAAAGAVGWARRLADHQAVASALGAGDISASWAREICGWTDRLPADRRAGADTILLAAAAGGAELADLAGLAEEMHRRCARPDPDDGGFADRWLRLDLTLHGAGRVAGDLTPQCTAALKAVLEALGKKAGPEDVRSKAQRDHDALEEACRRLIGTGCLPERAGQPTQIHLHMTLDQLRGLPGAAGAEADWAARGPAAPPGADCDASIVPLVSGHVDPAVLDQLAAALRGDGRPPGSAWPPPHPQWPRPLRIGPHPGPGRPLSRAPEGLPSAGLAGIPADAAVRALVLRHAADLLSGPAGLAAFLRTRLLDGAAGVISLPLDVGQVTEQIPPHLRRAVIARDRCCRFPGCQQPPAACQVHHLRPRSEGGLTRLTNLILLCPFHHLIAVHRWGWQINLNPDGTLTAVSPDRQQTLHSHGPPARAA
jgi:hypothetical protein